MNGMNKMNSKFYLIYVIMALCILFKIFDFLYNKVDYNSSSNLKNIQSFIAKQISFHNYDENMKLASTEFNNGNYKQAVIYYTYAIKQKQDSSEAYYKRAQSKLENNDIIGAIEDFKITTELNPNNIDALYNHASLIIPNYSSFNYPYIEFQVENFEYVNSCITNKSNIAIKELDKVIHVQPKNSNAYIYRGIAKSRLKKFNEASTDFNCAIGLSPNNSFAYFAKGNMYSDLVEYKEYLIKQHEIKIIDDNYFKKSLVNKQKELHNNYNDNRDLSKIYRDEYLIILRNYNKAIALDPKFEEAYFNRGTLYWNLNNYTEAIKDFKKVLSINPNDNDACINIIYVKIDLAKFYRDKDKLIYKKLSNEIINDYNSLTRKYAKDMSMTKNLKELKNEIDEEISKSGIVELYKK